MTGDGRTESHAGPWVGHADGLSQRESQVLVLCAEGLSNREIADALYVNVETVKSHLKHLYQRLGLRNRVEATAYVHRTAPDRMLQLDGRDTQPHDRAARREAGTAPTSTFDSVPVDEPALEERRRLMGLDEVARARLWVHAGAVERGAAAFVARQVARWADQPATAALVEDPAAQERLVEHQRRYLVDLFSGPLDADHARAMLRTGVTHHRIHLSPEWYLLSYVHVVCDHLDVVFGPASDGIDGVSECVEAVVALVASTLFDAGLVLDAYEMSVAEETLRDVGSRSASSTTSSAPPPVATAGAPTPRSIARVPWAGDDDTAGRRTFVGIDTGVTDVLRDLTEVVASSMPAVLESFYALIAETPGVAGFVPDHQRERLQTNVAAHWRATTLGDFDRRHAASLLRVGVIHEQIGLAPQYYLAGVARQLAGILRAIGAEAVRTGDLHRARRRIDAIVRAAFFDMSFVIDAYLDTRSQALLQTGRFAGQLLAGLSTGVAIVDGRDRIEFANEHLLGMAGVSAAVLRRMPVEAALPLEGVVEMIDAARRAVTGRAAALHRWRGRHFRVTAMRVQHADGGDGQVAVVVDDLSDVVRASVDLEYEDRRFGQVLAAVHAVAWEIELDSFTVIAVSSPAEALVGVRDIDLLGRPMPMHLVHADDRQRMRSVLGRLDDGEHVAIDHRMVRPDGTVRWMRSTAVGSPGPRGVRTVSGVTVDVTDVHDELDRLRSLLDHSTE